MPPRFADMPQKSQPEIDCPRCGGEVKRVHRRTHETQTLSGSGLRRYRCESEGCGWQGLLSRTSSARPAARQAQPLTSEGWRVWAVAVVVLVLLGLVSAGLALLAMRPDAHAPDGGQPVKRL